MADAMSDPLSELAALEGVPSAVMAARDAVDAVLRDRGRRSVTPEQSAAALLQAAQASAAIENRFGDVHREAEDQTGQAPDDHLRTVDWEAATTRLYVSLLDIAPLVRVSPGQAIARTHAVLGRGLLPDDQLGRIRSDPGTGGRIAALGRTLTAPTAAPVIVVAAVAHAELITVAPFDAGNGIVARAVEHMIMIDGDLDRPAVTVPEQAHLESGAAYRRALEGYRSGSAQGVRDWLLQAAAAVVRGAEVSPLKPVRRPGRSRPT